MKVKHIASVTKAAWGADKLENLARFRQTLSTKKIRDIQIVLRMEMCQGLSSADVTLSSTEATNISDLYPELNALLDKHEQFLREDMEMWLDEAMGDQQ